MQTMNHLRGRMTARARAARALVAENGDRRWSPAQQQAFDTLMDDHDQAQTELHRMRGGNAGMGAGPSQALEGLAIFLRKRDQEYTDRDRTMVRNTMSTTTTTQGGYTVTTGVAGVFVDSLAGYGWMRGVADQTTTDTGADLGYPVSDGTAEVGESIAQNATATTLDPSFATRSLASSKVGSKIFTVPIELLQDSQFDVVGYVLRRARTRIGRRQNVLFTTGSGTGEPTGLVTAASVGKTGTTGQTLTITYDDLVDLSESVDEASLGMPDAQADAPESRPGWMASQSMRKVIRKVKDTSGRPIWLPGFEDGSHGAADAVPRLLGYPFYVNNDMPVPGASAKSVAFGNLRSYLVRDVLGFELRRFDDSAYVKLGQVGFLAWARAGGNLLDVLAVKLYQHSAT